MRRIFNHPKPCINCGKPAKKDIESYAGTEPYRGNLRVLRSTTHKHGDNSQIVAEVLWDGESYAHYCGHFCTNRCAQEFANAIVDGKERWR
tara:strand:+ start:3766 stop:4038 length:273 start_codon:yes stop_codon:yes gene_type:complete